MTPEFIGHDTQPVGSNVVYWIHKPEHTNPFTEGYIGITKSNALQRWKGHIYERKRGIKRNRPLSFAIQNESYLIFQVLIVNESFDDCLTYEKILRPKPMIGWNVMPGANVIDPTIGGELNRQRWLDKKRADNPAYLPFKLRTEQARYMYQLRKARIDMYKQVFEPCKPANHASKRNIDVRNTSGTTGVRWYPKYGLWNAQIMVDGTQIGLGYYLDKHEASKAYQAADAIRIEYRLGNITLQATIQNIKSLRKPNQRTKNKHPSMCSNCG